jgi:hypothetical protein
MPMLLLLLLLLLWNIVGRSIGAFTPGDRGISTHFFAHQYRAENRRHWMCWSKDHANHLIRPHCRRKERWHQLKWGVLMWHLHLLLHLLL